jgi:hypothetical protein
VGFPGEPSIGAPRHAAALEEQFEVNIFTECTWFLPFVGKEYDCDAD